MDGKWFAATFSINAGNGGELLPGGLNGDQTEKSDPPTSSLWILEMNRCKPIQGGYCNLQFDAGCLHSTLRRAWSQALNDYQDLYINPNRARISVSHCCHGSRAPSLGLWSRCSLYGG